MSTEAEPSGSNTVPISTPQHQTNPRVLDDEMATEQTPLLLPRSTSISSTETLGSGRPHERQLGVKNATSTPPSSQTSRIRLIAMALSLWFMIFLQATNMSGMTLIQGTIAAELHTYGNSAMWFSSAYLIAMSSLAPIAGRLATIFPPRLLILFVAGLIATGSCLCAVAGTFGVFLAGRVVAGIGGAGVLTLTVIFGLELTTERTRGTAMAVVNAGFTAGVSFGAIVFGGLMPVIGWRPLFWAQVPFALVTGLGVYLAVPRSESQDRGTVMERLKRIDYLGASLLVLTMVLFLYSLAVEIQILPLATSLVIFVLFLFVEHRVAADPIIPVAVLSSRGILFSCLSQLGTMSARWSVLFYSPIFMLAARGDSPAAAGSILLPTNLGFALGGLIVGWLHIRRDGAFWLPSALSLLMFSLTLYILSLVASPDLPIDLFVLAVLSNGLATGAVINYTLAHVLHLSHKSTRYVATSLIATFRGFGGSFGTAIGGGIFYRLLRSSLASGFLDLDGGDQLSEERKSLVSKLAGTPGMVFGGHLNGAERQVAVEAYAGATRGVWQAATALGLAMVVAQAATGWTAPSGTAEDDDVAGEDATENEDVGEA